jgi:hypothetical protein
VTDYEKEWIRMTPLEKADYETANIRLGLIVSDGEVKAGAMAMSRAKAVYRYLESVPRDEHIAMDECIAMGLSKRTDVVIDLTEFVLNDAIDIALIAAPTAALKKELERRQKE